MITVDDIDKMERLKAAAALSNIEIRIKIAKIRGFRIVRRKPLTPPTGFPYWLKLNARVYTRSAEWRCMIGSGDGGISDVPFYHTNDNWFEWADVLPKYEQDLNETYKFEVWLAKKYPHLAYEYDELLQILRKDNPILWWVMVSARQRCEALIVLMERELRKEGN